MKCIVTRPEPCPDDATHFVGGDYTQPMCERHTDGYRKYGSEAWPISGDAQFNPAAHDASCPLSKYPTNSRGVPLPAGACRCPSKAEGPRPHELRMRAVLGDPLEGPTVELSADANRNESITIEHVLAARDQLLGLPPHRIDANRELVKHFEALGIEYAHCTMCRSVTHNIGSKKCDGCWEVERRLASYLRDGGADARKFVETALGSPTTVEELRKHAVCFGDLAVADTFIAFPTLEGPDSISYVFKKQRFQNNNERNATRLLDNTPSTMPDSMPVLRVKW